jgi:glycosyltransferase involved in cell wall biosynthesis
MKILFLSDNFPPEVNALATRTYEHCKLWVNQGHEVTVITCFPNFPQGKIYPGYKNKLYQKEIIDGIRVIRVWSYITPNSGFLKRGLDQLSSAFTSSIAGLFIKKTDYIIASSPQFFSAWAAFFLSLVKRTPWVFEVRDMWPEGIIFLNRDSYLYKILEKIELGLYRSADKIVVVTESFKNSIVRRSQVSSSKVRVIYNGSNNELLSPREKNQEILRKLKLEDKFIIGYAGTLGISHSLDFIFSEILKISNSKIHFLFIGDGALRGKLEEFMHAHNMLNVTILDLVGKNEIVEYLSIFDVGLVPLKKNKAYLKVIPSKTFELAAMNIPILLGVDGEMRRILEEYQSGIFFQPENSNSFQAAVDSFYKNRGLANNKYSQGLSKMKKDFNRRDLALKMIEFLHNDN